MGYTYDKKDSLASYVNNPKLYIEYIYTPFALVLIVSVICFEQSQNKDHGSLSPNFTNGRSTMCSPSEIMKWNDLYIN